MNNPSPEAVEKLTSYRGNQWQDAINQELQYLITAASEIRSLISNAKTETKRRFYKKKFAKIQKQVFQALIAKQRIDSRMGTANIADDPLGIAELPEKSVVDEAVARYNPPQLDAY